MAARRRHSNRRRRRGTFGFLYKLLSVFLICGCLVAAITLFFRVDTIEVTGMERARFEGSAKLPPCSMAKLTLKIFGGAKGDTTVTHRLYLHTKTQGLLGAFFESIGQCKRGETFRPRWNEVVGAKGICKLGIHEYTRQSGPHAGETGQSNEVQRFLPPPEPKAAPTQGWTQGAF